jgi:dTDP-4-dehydrorhamnose reductase
VYARTKYEAEQTVREVCPDALIVRTNFYGWGTSVRKSFSDWILEGLEGGRPLTMFTDVFFTPILINDLSDLILTLAARGATGTYHVAGGERVTKFEFAVQMAETFGAREPDIRQASVAGFPFRAVRPRDMSLNCREIEELMGIRMPGVRQGLERLRALRAEGWGRAVRAAAGEVPSAVGSPAAG